MVEFDYDITNLRDWNTDNVRLLIIEPLAVYIFIFIMISWYAGWACFCSKDSLDNNTNEYNDETLNRKRRELYESELKGLKTDNYIYSRQMNYDRTFSKFTIDQTENNEITIKQTKIEKEKIEKADLKYDKDIPRPLKSKFTMGFPEETIQEESFTNNEFIIDEDGTKKKNEKKKNNKKKSKKNKNIRNSDTIGSYNRKVANQRQDGFNCKHFKANEEINSNSTKEGRVLTLLEEILYFEAIHITILSMCFMGDVDIIMVVVNFAHAASLILYGVFYVYKHKTIGQTQTPSESKMGIIQFSICIVSNIIQMAYSIYRMFNLQ